MTKGVIISILFFTCSNVFSQEVERQRIYAIDSIVNKYIYEYSIVGLSIGIVYNDDDFTKQYGTTDLVNNYPVSDSTMFNVASISKLFTATAIMQLVETGKLNLDDKLSDILPDFKMKDKRYRDIKISHLLTHSSGLMWDNKLKESPDDTTSISLCFQNLSNKKLNFSPGEEMSYLTYSNAAYDLLGMVIEKISGKRFDEYIEQNILQPVKMYRSTYYYEDIDSSCLAIPQIVAGNSKSIKRLNTFGIDSKRKPVLNERPVNLKSYEVYGEDYEHNPSGNLVSSAYELNLWMQYNLRMYSDTAFNGNLNHHTLSEMWTMQREIPGKKTSIGWGWWIHNDDKLGKSVFHVGNNPGFCCILMIYPEQKFGITVLCNGSYAQKAIWNSLTKEIATLFIGS
jgi:CubicO group peptidase (beta-lactamase class C family)